jgi:hypothetical protein
MRHGLYLEAEAVGVRSTGIGCFFDDEITHCWNQRLLLVEPVSLHHGRRDRRCPAFHIAAVRVSTVKRRTAKTAACPVITAGVRVSLLAPQGLSHGLGKRREHDIEADADSHQLALVGIYRVRQPSGKND